MSSQSHYPYIFAALISKYEKNQLSINNLNTYVKVSGTTVKPNVKITKMSQSSGNNYIDLVVDTEIQFSSNGGVVEEVQVSLSVPYLNYTLDLPMCARPNISVGSGTVTLNQRFITRFYKQQ